MLKTQTITNINNIRLVVTISQELADRLKKTIPARKRSDFVANAIEERLMQDEKKQWWQNVQTFRNSYNPKKDSIKMSAADWLKKDRQSH